ncbi:hypothetical protein SKAU_G00116960 [Synaphobranchus kaupii]|uniref:WxxW domain-containing protein n=1 Tax=Synaphobranchus kaupii TaxID=118154 RepID=A0A9Q1FND5_SYNKA|nr:hypothetical protein SKAU_G00116960 [Synaphobranchus kaupii]
MRANMIIWVFFALLPGLSACDPCPCNHSTTIQCWTDWFDRDDPCDDGDFETLPELLKEYPGRICPHPQQIQYSTVDGTPSNISNVIDV